MTDRQQALARLKATLTKQQVEDLQLVIQTADVQGDYIYDGDGSHWTDDVNDTLMALAGEFS